MSPGDARQRPTTPEVPPSEPEQASPAQFSCRIELFGLARSIAGRRDVEVTVYPGDRIADILRRLAAACPDLAGRVIRPDGAGLSEGHALNLNGTSFVDDLTVPVGPGDVVLILSNTAGG